MAGHDDRVTEDERIDKLDEVSRKVIKVAASTVVASSLAGALAEPPRADLITLPEPTPIVQMYQAYDDDEVPDEDDEQEKKTSRWRRLLRVLKMLAVVLALLGTIALGLLKGCAGLLAVPLLHGDDEQQEQVADDEGATDAESDNSEADGVAEGLVAEAS